MHLRRLAWSYLALAFAGALQGCFLDRTSIMQDSPCTTDSDCDGGQICSSGGCRPADAGVRDAGTEDAARLDGGPDSGAPDAGHPDATPGDSGPADSGTPAHCLNGVQDEDEAAPDCGGSCVSCLPGFLVADGWWRADLGVTTSALEVTEWSNQGTASGLDLMQGVAARRPDLVDSSAAFNGQAAINFDAGDVLASVPTGEWELEDDGGQLTVICVFSQRIAGLFTTVGTDDPVQGGFALQPRVGAGSRFLVYDAAALLMAEGQSFSIDAVHVHAGVYDGAPGPTVDAVQTWVDGMPGASATRDQGRIAHEPDEEFLVGAPNANATGGFPGEISEVILVRRALTALEDASLAEYLNARYGLGLTRVVR